MSDMPMKNVTAVYPYLTFNGNCREAMTFYNEALGGELNVMNFEGSGMESEETKDRVMHATLVRGALIVMASDGDTKNSVSFGNNVSLSVNCESREQTEEFFHKLVEGGTATMPLQDTFWGAYFGMCTDKFGIHWMFNYDAPRS